MESDNFIRYADILGNGMKFKLNLVPTENAFVIFNDVQMISITIYS